MPSKSKKQARFMAAVAHNPAFARKVGVPQSVGEDFNAADEATGILGMVGKKRRPYNALPSKRGVKRQYDGPGPGGE